AALDLDLRAGARNEPRDRAARRDERAAVRNDVARGSPRGNDQHAAGLDGGVRIGAAGHQLFATSGDHRPRDRTADDKLLAAVVDRVADRHAAGGYDLLT